MNDLVKTSVEGTITYARSDPPSRCICCPDSPSHIFCRYIQFDPFESIYPEHFGQGADEFIGTAVLYNNSLEGRRVRLTIEIIPEG